MKHLRLWDTASGILLHTFEGHSGIVTSVAFSPDERTVLSGSWDSTLRLWDIASGQLLHTLEDHSGPVLSVAFSPDGRTVLSGSADNTLRLWDTASGILLHTFEGHSGQVNSVAFSPDGRTALSGSADGTLRLWDTASDSATSGQLVRTFGGPGTNGDSNEVNSVAFSPGGRTVLSGSSGDRTLRLWDTASGTLLCTFEDHTSTVWSVAFSPDGRTALSGSTDGALRLWDTASDSAIFGQLIRTFGGPGANGHANQVRSVAFSPDGRTALSGSRDGTLRLWDIASGTLLHIFEGPSTVWSVAFSPDGRTVLSGSADTTLRLWRNHTLDELMVWTLENRYVPEFTCEERAEYNIEPPCDAQGVFPTRTPYLTWTPSPTAAATPTANLTHTTYAFKG